MIVQVRSETTGVRVFSSFKEALETAKGDPTIWKISFTVDGEHFRLVKLSGTEFKNGWVYDHIYGVS